MTLKKRKEGPDKQPSIDDVEEEEQLLLLQDMDYSSSSSTDIETDADEIEQSVSDDDGKEQPVSDPDGEEQSSADPDGSEQLLSEGNGKEQSNTDPEGKERSSSDPDGEEQLLSDGPENNALEGSKAAEETKEKDEGRWSEFVRWLFRPSDPAAIGLFRLLFGLFMIHDLMNERHMPYLARAWGEPVRCHFPLFDFITPVPLAWMHVVYLIMLIGAICIASGIVFGFTVWLYIVPYWYTFLLDKTRWNNHSYLYGLFALLFAFTDAGNSFSIDTILFDEKRNTHVPFWNYAIMRFQIFLVYFFAGLKKIDLDWLSGWSMQNLSKHWVFAPFSLIMSREMVDVLVVHLGGFTLDLFGGWLLLFRQTRPIAIVFLSKFHLMNASMFEIGMFPYVMLTTSSIFCQPSWPRDVARYFKNILFTDKNKKLPVGDTDSSDSTHDSSPRSRSDGACNSSLNSYYSPDPCQPSLSCVYSTRELNPKKLNSGSALLTKPSRKQKWTAIAIVIYVCIQCFLPWSHFITKGYNLWTEGLYGYSWDMMVQSWSLQHIRVSAVTNVSSSAPSEPVYLNPEAMTVGMGRRWSSHPDMIKQYGRCVERELKQLGMDDFSLHIDVWRSMNGRFQQRMIDPRVDILRANWSAFSTPDWTLPLLTSLTNWRGRLKEIKEEFRRRSEETKELPPWVVFAADFPGLSLENYVHEDLDETYLELLDGEVEVETGYIDDEVEVESANGVKSYRSYSQPTSLQRRNVTINEHGTRVRIPAGEYHTVHTKGSRPSCYMYIYVNSTDAEVWRNLTNQRELVDLMENATVASVGKDGAYWNFSDIYQVAQFANKSVDDAQVTDLHTRFLRRTADRSPSYLSPFLRFLDSLKTKMVDQMYKYGKALENAGIALISIARGISMEELQTERRLERESARIGESNGST